MSLLNPVTAALFGIVAALYWAVLFLRRSFRRRAQHASVGPLSGTPAVVLAAIAFIPSCFAGFMVSFLASSFITPGPSVHVLLSLALALSISLVGAGGTILAGMLGLWLSSRAAKA